MEWASEPAKDGVMLWEDANILAQRVKELEAQCQGRTVSCVCGGEGRVKELEAELAATQGREIVMQDERHRQEKRAEKAEARVKELTDMAEFSVELKLQVSSLQAELAEAQEYNKAHDGALAEELQLRCKAEALAEQLRKALENMVVDEDRQRIGLKPYERMDHACVDCPASTMVVDGFLCSYHRAKDILALPEPKPSTQEGL